MNKSSANKLWRITKAAMGLVVCGCGVYLMVIAGIGLGSWEALNVGISLQTGVSYGTAALLSAAIIIILDILLKEKIGAGMILDAIITGKTVDLLSWLGFVSVPKHMWTGIVLMVAGMVVISIGQYIYMKQGVGCGPRDAFLVGLGRLVRKWPIGLVAVCMHLCVIAVAWIIGGPIGLGTILAVGCTGFIMQLVFSLVRFEPRDVKHESLLEMLDSITASQEESE